MRSKAQHPQGPHRIHRQESPSEFSGTCSHKAQPKQTLRLFDRTTAWIIVLNLMGGLILA